MQLFLLLQITESIVHKLDFSTFIVLDYKQSNENKMVLQYLNQIMCKKEIRT